MRKLFFILFLFPLFSNAQTVAKNDSIFKTKVDKFNGTKETKTDLIAIQNDGKELTWRIDIYEDEFIKQAVIVDLIASKASGLGCIDDKAKVVFLLKDGTKMELISGYSFNCDAMAGLYFHTKQIGSKQFVERLRKLRDIKVDAVRMDLRKGYYDYDFTEDQSNDFSQTIGEALKIIGKE